MMLAMKLQEEEWVPKPKPPPPAPIPSYIAPINNFVRQKHEENLPPSAEAVKRITADMKEIIMAKSKWIFISPDEEDITHIQALIIGPPDTPYAYGFFHFDMLFPHDYPWRPPKVQLITTDGGGVRFNPNLYANGKVCLSILGTWSGPSWTQVQTMMSTLLSIQSLMNPKPYHNEPGYEHERKAGEVEKYNQCITHETLRVAVCGMLENATCGELFREEMEELFLEHYDHYETICTNLQGVFDGKEMEDPFGERRGTFNYSAILKRLRDLKAKIEAKQQSSTTTTTVTDMQTEPTTTTTNVEPEPTPVVQEPQPEKPIEPVPVPEVPATTTTNTTTSTTTSTTTTDTSAPMQTDAVSAQLLDEQLAKMLQEQMYSEMYNEQNYYGKPKYGQYSGYGYGGQYAQSYSANPSPSHGTVKPPSISELAKEAQKDSDYDPDIVCVICRQSPKEYIVLPNCQQPHIHCMSCANKMLQNKPQQQNRYGYMPRMPGGRRHDQSGNSQTIQCVLCSSVCNLDANGGLNAIRRRKKRKVDSMNRSKCPQHNDDYLLYCTDDFELLCFECAKEHGKHNVEPFDTAQKQVQAKFANNLRTLQKKRATLETFVENVKQKKVTMSEAAEAAVSDIRKQMADLRQTLEAKEKELEEALKRAESNKILTVDNALKKAEEKISEIDESISTANEAMSESSPLEFFLKIETVEEKIRHNVAAPDPEVKSKWFEMPTIYPQMVDQAIRTVKLREKRANMQPGSYDYGYEEEAYSDEEDDY